MVHKDTAKKADQPILIKLMDAVTITDSCSMDYVTKHAQLETLWLVGFLIEINKEFIKFSSEHTSSGIWKYPVIWPKEHVEKVYKLVPVSNAKKPVELPKELPRIVHVTWGDGQSATANIATKTVIDRNVAKQIDTVGFLLINDSKRLVLTEQINLRTGNFKNIHVIYPKYSRNMLQLVPNGEIDITKDQTFS